MTPRQLFIQHARSYIGTPFVHQGRTRQGVDCVGFLIVVAREFNLIDPDYDYTNYGKFNDPKILLRELDRFMIRKSIKERIEGDIVCFALPSFPCHVAICSNQNKIIHALNTRKKVVEHTLTSSWEKKICSCYEIPGVDLCSSD